MQVSPRASREKIIEKENDLDKISADISQLTEITRDMNSLLSQQGDQLSHMEQKLESTQETTQKALGEIQKVASYQNYTMVLGMALCVPLGMLMGPHALIVPSLGGLYYWIKR